MSRRHAIPPSDEHLAALGPGANMDLDTLHYQADDLLAVRRCRLGGVPQRGEVARERKDSTTLILAELWRLFLQETIIFFLTISIPSQCLLPLSLQAASDEAILRLHRLVLSFGTFRLIGRPLKALLPVAMESLALLVYFF